MKNVLLLTALMATLFNVSNAQTINVNYDSLLATELGADDYGMKSYVFVILKTGNNTNTDKDFRSKCFKSHFENIDKLIKSGEMVVAGPYEKNEKNYRGLFIMNVTSFEEVNDLLANDLTVSEGIFDVEMYNWYGPAALSTYLEASEKVWKIQP